MTRFHGEPTIREVLSDPIVKTLMRADAVDPRELDVMLSDIARKLHAAGRGHTASTPQHPRHRDR